MRFANLRDPVTLQRSPMLTKVNSGVTTRGSRPVNGHFQTFFAMPDRVVYGEHVGIVLGLNGETAWAIACM